MRLFLLPSKRGNTSTTSSPQTNFRHPELLSTDTLKKARQTFGKCDEYKEFCIENGFTLANGRTPRFTAEILYKFITKDLQFEEEHTGLADVRIEREIFRHCVQMDPSIERRLWVN